MEALTLTLALSEHRPDDFTTFAFMRTFDGEGNWVTRDSKANMPANCMAPLELQFQLSGIARARGMSEAHNFSRVIPKPPKPEKVPRGPRKPRASKSKVPAGLLGGFNPFAVGA